MARATLVFSSFIGAAFLLETICKEELPIIVPKHEPVIHESITQEVKIDTPTIPLDLTNSCAVARPKVGS